MRDALSVLYPIRTGGDKPPFFCVHPGGGLSWCYMPLARYVPAGYPLYGLQARGLNGNEQPAGSIREMAADYIDQIRAVQESGPYQILGWSFGGVVAHEMAVQLQDAGQQVAALIIMDAYPELNRPSAEAEREARRGEAADGAGTAGEPGPADRPEAAAEGDGARPAEQGQPAEPDDAGAADRREEYYDDIWRVVSDEDRMIVQRVFRNSQKITDVHEFRRFEGDALLIAAGESDGAPIPSPATWQPYVSGEISELCLPCGHGDMIRTEMLAKAWDGISAWLRRGREDITGDLVQTLQLAVTQAGRGYDLIVLTDQPDGMLARACHQHGIPVTAVAGLREARSPRPVPQVMTGLMAEFRNFGAELIHCHSLACAAQAIPAGNRLDIPCVCTLHAVTAEVFLDGVKGSGLNFTTIAVSRSQAELLSRSGVIPPGTIHYVPHGTKSVPSGQPRRQAEPAAPSLILVGSLSFRKGIDIAILVMADLRRRRGPDCPSLSIYGQGLPAETRPGRPGQQASTRTFFEEMTSVLALDDIVHFRGLEPDVLSHCPATDILIVPSRKETGPLVVLEAMSRGMPIVTADVGEVTEMLHLLMERHRSRYASEKVAERVEEVYKQAAYGNP